MNGQMEQEKQIEEMARDICECYNNDGTCYQDDKPCDLRCEHMTEAQFLYDKGYRKVVMCKDCKYFFNEHIKACTYWNGHATTETNYCSCAKMRGE